MSRIRSVHPEQWTDPEFVSCTPVARLLAIGIRNEADDNGVFEWNPIKLKMRVLAADNCDVSTLLDELIATNQVTPFEADGRKYGLIRSFQRYQKPKEPSFKYPLPPASMVLGPGYAFHKNGPSRPDISPVLPQDFGKDVPVLPQDFGKDVSDGEDGRGEVIPTMSGAAAPPSVSMPAREPDPIFGHCLEFLTGKGCATRGARSFLGLMRKDHGDAALVQAIERAEREDITDPIPWVRKYLEGKPKTTPAKSEAWAEGLL